MIKAPFNYTGSKARHWPFIKDVFESKKNNFIDLFAGSLTTPLSIKEAFPEVKVLANVKDETIECFLSYSLAEIKDKYIELLNLMTEDGKISLEGVRKDKDLFNTLRKNYKRIFKEVCHCCGHELKKKEVDELTHITAACLCDIKPNKDKHEHSLGYNAFNKDKIETLEKYFNYLGQIEVTTNYFDDTQVYHDSFIHLDPPYIETVKAKNRSFTGFNYSNLGDGGTAWNYDDNERLIKFITNNLGKNNAILLWGSQGNHLESLLREYLDGEYFEFKRRQNVLGHTRDVIEYAFLLH